MKHPIILIESLSHSMLLPSNTMKPFTKVDSNTFKDSQGIVYKSIPNYEDYYVNEQGEVFSAKYGRWKQLSTNLNENGYRRVTLRQHGKTVVRRIARLTATAFHPTNNTDRNVFHLDCNKLNDHYSNLKWDNSAD